MSLRSVLRSVAQRFASLENPSTPLSAVVIGDGRTRAGERVTADTALQCVAVLACVRVLAESVAQLPLAVYRRLPDGGAQEAPEHPLFPILHAAPNHWQTSFEWREMAMGHAALRGNFFAFISRDGTRPDAAVLELLPLHPDTVTVEQRPDWTKLFHVTGRSEPYTARDVLHLAGLSTNGAVGITPITQAREAVGLALAAEAHGARLFGNGARPGGLLSHPGKLSKEAADRLKASWQEQYAGEHQHRTAILEEGMTWTQLGMTSEDAQFLETRKFQRGEIASLFRIPPHLIGDLERATFSNIEQQSIEFVVHTLMPWVKRWEQRLARQLLSPADQKTHFVRFKLDGLLRGDTKSRYDAYAIAITNGWMSRNEVRALEGLNRVDGLDAYLTPLNMSGGQPTPAAPTSEAA